MPPARDYQAIAHNAETPSAIHRGWEPLSMSRPPAADQQAPVLAVTRQRVIARMRVVVDALWRALHPTGVSWVGFYLDQPGLPDDQRLVLGPCRDKPACSPIGLHGVCGQALRARQVRIVSDVRALGSNYVACDPRDRSEIVVPLINGLDQCWAVLDLDSWELGAFDQADADGLKLVLAAVGLLHHGGSASGTA